MGSATVSVAAGRVSRHASGPIPPIQLSVRRAECVWRDAKHGGRDARAPPEIPLIGQLQ